MSNDEERLRRALHMIDELRLREALATIRERTGYYRRHTMAEKSKFVVTIEAESDAPDSWPIRAMMVTIEADNREEAEHFANDCIDGILEKFGAKSAFRIDNAYEI